MDKHSVLQHYFGHREFRKGQEPLIDCILNGGDALGVMPTGGGKSLCYQVPALLLEGMSLVVSPLISLMKDQVMALKEAGVNAAYLNSSLSENQMRTVYRRIGEGAYKILYVAPERLMGEGFQALMQQQSISLVAVDEAHCISQWGQDFRPSYLKIKQFIDILPKRPVVCAFTATATELVRQDIEDKLALREPLRIVTGFDRPNLYFDVLRPTKKPAVLQRLVLERAGKSGIVYCATRSGVERVCQALVNEGISATRYHAGLSDEERQHNQDDFQFDRSTVMVATNAFGMGIDKSNVSYVIHYNMPKNLEAYYQEAGRAGRDGAPADCILLYSASDIATAKSLISLSNENERDSEQVRQTRLEQDEQRLNVMIDYCKQTGCLRSYILAYFGQEQNGNCQNCGNCSGSFTQIDITTQAQMILSCVKRVRDFLGYAVGTTLIVNTLSGSRDQRVLALRLDSRSTYGLMKGLSKTQIRSYIEFLTEQGYLFVETQHMTLQLTPAAASVLYRGAHVEMPQRIMAEEPILAPERNRRQEQVLQAPPELYESLRALRAELAREEGVPAYIVFSNATLADMANKCPQTKEEFLLVSGVGERKAQRYAEAFLKLLKDTKHNYNI